MEGFKQTKIVKRDFIGTWRITKMSEWDNDYVNEEVQAFIKIEKSRMGEFHFGPWEQIFYLELDGQRKKRVMVKVIGE